MRKSQKFPKIQGFRFAGLYCGIKEKQGSKDLGAIVSEAPATKVAGLFTTNSVKAAPVKFCQKQLKNSESKLIVINSGNANAATGKKGEQDCSKMAALAGKAFGIQKEQVLICSTGKIGVPLPMAKIKDGLKKLPALSKEENFYDCLQAIMTTDLFPKWVSTKIKLGNKTASIAILAKGAGMIHPNMATLLSFVVSDLALSKGCLKKLLKDAVEKTLNMTSVDGDMSTNDTILMMTNGMAKNKTITSAKDPQYAVVKKALTKLLEEISLMIVQDGEGAKRAFVVEVKNARSENSAKKIARAITTSSLVKTAIYGGDPNWGRIICAAGYSDAIIENKASVALGPHKVFHKGRPLVKSEKPASLYLKKNKVITLSIDLGLGKHSAKAFGSDLGHEYVTLNSEYRT